MLMGALSMIKSNYRFLFYGLVGLAFGVIDWFYLNALAHFSWGSLRNSFLVVPIILLLNYGIWLVPVVPIGIYESNRDSSTILSPAACSLTWVCSMVGYYGYYALLFVQGKLPMLENMRLRGINDIAFWQENWNLFKRVIIDQFFEWTLIAIVCGSIIGAVLFKIARRKRV